jgi:isoamylase
MLEAKQLPMRSNASRSITQRGTSSPLGATPCRDGVNFSVFSKHATGVELLLFDRVDDAKAARVIRIDPAANRTYHYWHVFVPGVIAGQIYGYRGEGAVGSGKRHALRSRKGPPRPVWPWRGGSGSL